MPPCDIEVEPAALPARAAHVDPVADELRTARWAGKAIGPGSGAFDRLCVAAPMLLGWLQDTVIDAVSTAARSLHDSGDRLRQTPTGYRASDQQAHTRINRAGGR